MRIFQIKNQVEGFATINFGDINMMSILKTGDVSILDGKHFSWNKTIGNAISDCPFFIGAMPIFSTEKLGDALLNTNAKTATFNVEGSMFTIVAALPIVGKVINTEKSKCRLFRNGKIMEVAEYVLNNASDFADIFTLQEYPMYTFCELDIAKRLQLCHFKHLILKECSII
jgi:hypothetical protein